MSTIMWLDAKIEEVREVMKRKPSKVRHLNDLIRQREDSQRSIEGFSVEDYESRSRTELLVSVLDHLFENSSAF